MRKRGRKGDTPMPIEVVQRYTSQKKRKLPPSPQGKKTSAPKTTLLIIAITSSSIIFETKYVMGRYKPSFLSLSHPKNIRSGPCLLQRARADMHRV